MREDLRGSPRAERIEVRRYQSSFVQTLAVHDLGGAVTTAALAADQLDLIRDGVWSADARDALERVGGHIPNGALHYFSAHQLMGWTNALAGTIFEQTVAQLADDGKFALPGGADHVLLAGRTQRAWDLALMHHDEVVGHAQVKFSKGAATIVQHLHHHPDVTVVIANHEAAMAAQRAGIHVIDSGVAYDSIHHHVATEVGNHIGAAHFVHEWVPEFAALIILARAANKFRDGQPADEVWDWTKEELHPRPKIRHANERLVHHAAVVVVNRMRQLRRAEAKREQERFLGNSTGAGHGGPAPVEVATRCR